MPDAASLLARIGADTSQYRTELQQSKQETSAFAGEMRESLASVGALTEKIGFQERELDALQGRLAASRDQSATFAAEAAKSATAIDGLTEKIEFQQRDLGLLEQRYAAAVQTNGIFDAATQKLQLQVDKLSTSLGNNQTALANEQARLAEVSQAKSSDTEQTARLQLQIDKLSSSMIASGDALNNEKQHLADLANESARVADEAAKANPIGEKFGEIWTGALRQIGAMSVTAVVDSMHALADAAGNFIETGIDSYGATQQLTSSFEALIASEERTANATLSQTDAMAIAAPKAAELLKWNQQLAIDSPFSEEGVAKAFRQAEAMGFVSDTASTLDVDAKRLTQTLIDTAAATGGGEEQMSSLARTLGQVNQLGKLQGDNWNQLTEAGINVGQILSEAFKKPLPDILAMRESGQLLASDVIPAIVEGLENRFAGAAKAQADSVTGLKNSLGDLYAIAARDIIGPAVEAAMPAVKELVATLQNPATRAEMQALGKSIGDFARTEIPVLVEQGKALVTTLGDAYTTAKPIAEFIGQNFTPIVAGLGAAYAATLVPGIIASTTALYAMAPAAVAATGPLGIIAGAIFAVGVAYQHYEGQVSDAAQKTAEHQQAYQDSTQALDAYGKATDSVREKMAPLADAIQHEREVIEEQIRAEGEARNAGETQEESDSRMAGIRSHLLALTQLNTQITTRSQNETAAQAVTSSYNDVEALRLQRTQASTQATQAQIKAVSDLTDAERKKLDASGGKVDDGQDKLGAAQDAYQQAEAGRLAAHTDKLHGIESKAFEDRTAAQQTYADARTTATTDFNSKIEDLEATAARKRTDDAYAEGQRRLGSEKTLSDALAGITQTRNDQQVAYDHQRELDAGANTQKIGDIQQKEADRALTSLGQLNTQMADLQGQQNERLAAYDRDCETAAADHRDKLAAFQRGQADDEATYTRARGALQQGADDEQADRQTTLYNKLSDLRSGYAEDIGNLAESTTQKLQSIEQTQADKDIDIEESRASKIADIRTSLASKTQDLQENASYKQEDSTRDFGYDNTDRLDAHNDKVKDIQAKLDGELNVHKREAIQQSLDAENQRYADEQAKAQRDFDRKQEQAQRELARQEQQAQQEAQRAEAAAAVDAQRQTTQAAQTADRARTAAEQQATIQREHLEQSYNDAVASAQRDTARANQQAQVDLERDRRTLQEKRQLQIDSYAQQQQDIDAAYGKQLAAQDQKLGLDIGKLNEARTKAQESYTEREADAKAHYERDLASQQTNYQQQLTALDYKYGQEKLKLDRSVVDAQTAFTDREAKAKASYDRQSQQDAAALTLQETNARTSYTTKMRDLQKNLDDQNKAITKRITDQQQAEAAAYLKAETDAQTAYGKQREQLLKALGEQLEDYTVQQQTLSLITAQEATRRAKIIAASTGADAEAAGNDFANTVSQYFSSSSGGGVNFRDIIINGADDPQKTAQAVRDELNRSYQQNGTSPLGKPN